ncbi:P2Y purinoceptor 2 [Biomphalaria glabrata]|nr:P2Y purinoceptor 2 [Biomphalaria glabrata]
MEKQNGSLHLNSTAYANVNFFSDEEQALFDFWFSLVATNCLNVWSCLSNIINVIVFSNQGVKKGVNFTLLCLSYSDLMGALLTIIATTGLAVDGYIMSKRIDGKSIFIFFTWIGCIFVDLSTALTVFISIERCTCVTRPLHYNSSFLALHTRGIIVIIIVFLFANYLPLWTTLQFDEVFNRDTNSSVFVISFSSVNVQLQQCNDYFFCTCLASVALICVFVCAIIMYRALNKSSRVRRSTHTTTKKNNSQLTVLSTRERQVVKTVFFLACLYMVSATPRIWFCWAFVLDDVGGLYLLLIAVYNFISTTYGAFSFFIYYNFNSSYRAILFQFFLPTHRNKH